MEAVGDVKAQAGVAGEGSVEGVCHQFTSSANAFGGRISAHHTNKTACDVPMRSGRLTRYGRQGAEGHEVEEHVTAVTGLLRRDSLFVWGLF